MSSRQLSRCRYSSHSPGQTKSTYVKINPRALWNIQRNYSFLVISSTKIKLYNTDVKSGKNLFTYILLVNHINFSYQFNYLALTDNCIISMSDLVQLPSLLVDKSRTNIIKIVWERLSYFIIFKRHVLGKVDQLEDCKSC